MFSVGVPGLCMPPSQQTLTCSSTVAPRPLTGVLECSAVGELVAVIRYNFAAIWELSAFVYIFELYLIRPSCSGVIAL